MENGILKVQMLGTFGLEYNGKQISFERNNTTKTNQLLQLLLISGKDGVSRAQLLNTLFGREEITNPATSLRTTVFRLRRLLAKELPDIEYVVIKSGMYYWNDEIPVEIDVNVFEEKAKAALASDSTDLLFDACRYYSNEFLPELKDVEWVVVRQVQYRNQYFACLERLTKALLEEKRYEALFNVAKNAVDLYPYDEWQIPLMDCLIAMGKEKEATELYQETAELYFSELGVEPSEQMKERFQKIAGADAENYRIDGVLHSMDEEEEASGAYYCSYPSFAETYRYIKRVIERSGQSAYLLQVTIVDGKGIPLEREERVEKVGDELKDAIHSALRRGDLFTQYRANVFLMLLMEIKQEDLEGVIDRINSKFIKPSRKNYLAYSFAPISEVDEPETNMVFAQMDSIWK